LKSLNNLITQILEKVAFPPLCYSVGLSAAGICTRQAKKGRRFVGYHLGSTADLIITRVSG